MDATSNEKEKNKTSAVIHLLQCIMCSQQINNSIRNKTECDSSPRNGFTVEQTMGLLELHRSQEARNKISTSTTTAHTSTAKQSP
jgi:hypothetical protein